MPKLATQIPQDIPIPIAGLDESSAFSSSRPLATRACSNVRNFDCVSSRDGLAKRPGMAKYIATQISSSPIQYIDSIPISLDQRVGTGDMLCQGATSTTFAMRGLSAGTTISLSGTLTAAGAHTQGCFDEDGNAYEVSASTTGTATVRVKKIGTDYAVKWTTDLLPSASGNPQIFGCAAFNGVVYVWIVGATAGSVTDAGIWRVATADGTSFGLWLTNASNGLATVGGTQTAACQCLAAGGGLLGVVGAISGALVFQRVALNGSLAPVTGQVILQATLLNHPAKMITDSGNNFYVLTNCTGGAVNKLFKINSSGIQDTVFNSGTAIVSDTATATDIAYNPITFQIGVVGTDIFTSTNESFQTYNATTGAKVAGAQQSDNSGAANWNAITCDDQTSSQWRLRRSVATGNNDIIAVSDPGGSISWAVQSGLGVITPHLWLACSGVQVASAAPSMQSSRTVRALAIAGGALYRFDNGVANITSSFCSASASVVWGAVNGLIEFFVDGSNVYPTYNASTNTANVLTASAGTLPTDSNGNKCRLICTWRGRLVMAGLKSDPHNWFMSRVDAPTDWDYGATPYANCALAGSNAPAGKCADIITCLIPYSDDLLIMGGDHSIWVMRGDPAAGGRIDQISPAIGMAWGRPYCIDPSGILYFMSSRGSVYRMTPEGRPQKISDAIDSRLVALDLADYIVTMQWDQKWNGFHLFVSPIDPTAATTNYWWNAPANAGTPQGSWWPDTFGSVNFNPIANALFDGDDPDDRKVIMGGRDGYLRVFDDSVATDDGSTYTGSCLLGPIHDRYGIPIRMTDLQATMTSGSGSVTYTVRAGESIEAAFNATAHVTGTFSASRNRSQAIRVFGHAEFVNLSGTAHWALDELKCVIEPVNSAVAQRAF